MFGDSEVESIKGKFGAKGVNKNGEKLIEFCMEKRMFRENTFYEKDINKYTWSSGIKDSRSLFDNHYSSKV